MCSRVLQGGQDTSSTATVQVLVPRPRSLISASILRPNRVINDTGNSTWCRIKYLEEATTNYQPKSTKDNSQDTKKSDKAVPTLVTEGSK